MIPDIEKQYLRKFNRNVLPERSSPMLLQKECRLENSLKKPKVVVINPKTVHIIAKIKW